MQTIKSQGIMSSESGKARPLTQKTIDYRQGRMWLLEKFVKFGVGSFLMEWTNWHIGTSLQNATSWSKNYLSF